MKRPGLKGKENEDPKEKVKSNPKDERINQLQSRLAKGEKAEVSKKEMFSLTNKNYSNLPEVAKKKEDEKKKEDFKKRMELKKEYDKKIRMKLTKKSN